MNVKTEGLLIMSATTDNELDFCPRCKCHLSTLRTDKNMTERKCYTCGIVVTDTVKEPKKYEGK